MQNLKGEQEIWGTWEREDGAFVWFCNEPGVSQGPPTEMPGAWVLAVTRDLGIS